ncbi:carbonic anhydrase family protein [Okeanomitos corallinicola TIOX110]|uniref:carbonic anhydrase n=1 Tax=Okeanomitos corallinicola TIOX110 TaxID=3133117 RepID=A0ABZ2UT94_9CYAN
MKLNLIIKKTSYLNLLVIVALFTIPITVFPTQALAQINIPNWSYSGDTNPNQWGKISSEFSLCEVGKNQSPINIENVQERKSIDLDFNYRPTPLSITDTGYNVQVNYQPGNKIKINNHEYELLQFHFHTPSEHTINSQPSVMEIHLLHRNSQGELAVLGVMIEPGKSNSLIDDIILYQVGKNEYATINAADLLPNNKNYFSYNGSLTTPPCSENVKWIIFVEPIQASKNQILAVQALYETNARPVQPRNDRIIQLHR